MIITAEQYNRMSRYQKALLPRAYELLLFLESIGYLSDYGKSRLAALRK